MNFYVTTHPRNDPNRKETRGRPRVISAEKLREMERILQEESTCDDMGAVGL